MTSPVYLKENKLWEGKCLPETSRLAEGRASKNTRLLLGPFLPLSTDAQKGRAVGKGLAHSGYSFPNVFITRLSDRSPVITKAHY